MNGITELLTTSEDATCTPLMLVRVQKKLLDDTDPGYSITTANTFREEAMP